MPHDVSSLVKIVQGLLIHPAWPEASNFPDERSKEFYLRSVPQMLERILKLDSRPLSMECQPEKRKVSICRDWAVLLISMLRHQGVHARLRIGFAGYFLSCKPRYVDHRITEYWNKKLNRWLLVDAMIDDIRRRRLKLQFDTLNIDSNSPFLLAGMSGRDAVPEKQTQKNSGIAQKTLGCLPFGMLYCMILMHSIKLNS